MGATKKAVLTLFPDKSGVFDLIDAPRFKKITKERFVIPGGLSIKERWHQRVPSSS